MKENNRKINVGGVALFNGILFTSKYRQVSIQRNNEKLEAKVIPLTEDKRIINKIPIIRGILGLSSQIGNSSTKFMESSGEEEKVGKFQTFFIYSLLIIFCIVMPIGISAFFNNALIRNIVQAILILVEFLIYILMMKLVPDLNTLFMYHGAEHKVVNAYENLDIEDITLENVKKQSRFHKRCGGNLIVYFVLLTIASLFIPINNLIVKAIAMIMISVLNIGIAYEIVNVFSKLPKPFDIINYPATLIQFATTKEPDEEMLKLAIYGVLGSVRKNNGITPNVYVKKYIKSNLKDKEYDVQDIYTVLEYVTNIDRNKLLLEKDNFLIKINQEIETDRLLNKYYIEKYPLQYLVHKQYFYNETYYVDENVLIPRSDTEILVEKAIEYIDKEEIKNMIDLCTGSGAIGISIAKNSNIESVELIDISLGALNVARRNILLNNVSEKVITRNSDLLSEKIKVIDSCQLQEEKDSLKADMIVSNPPYIKSDVVLTLQEEVKKEPHLALDGGKTGLDFYIRIIKEAKEVLKPNGILMFEIGYDQLEDLKNIIKENKEYKLLESVKDFGGNDRVVLCRFQGK